MNPGSDGRAGAPMADRLADAVLTLLVVNLLVAFVRGPLTVSIFGLALGTPSLGISLGLVLAWLGGRALLRRRDRLSATAARGWLWRRLPEVVVAALFAVGLAMRLTGIDFGKPLVVHPDEHQVVGVAITMLKAGSLAPPVPYHYPTVFIYLLLPAFGIQYVQGRAAGLWYDMGAIHQETFAFYELARAHSAVIGALTIVLIYVLARKLWSGARGRWAGVLAAAFVTFSFNHVKESHYGVTDATLTFFVVLAFLAILSAFRRGTVGAYALAGFAAGIACATKYSALPVAVTLIVAHLLDVEHAWRRWPRLLAGMAAVPVGFFTGYPYALLNWPAFLEHLGWMSSFSGSDTFDPATRFGYVASYAAESGFGLLFTAVLAVALVHVLHRRRPEPLLAVTVIAVSLALLARTEHRFFPRYLLPILPFAAVIVGGALAGSAAWISRRWPGRATLTTAGVTVTALVLVWPQARESFAFIEYVTLPDTRAQARAYIIGELPAGTVVATEDPYLRLPLGYTLYQWSPLHAEPLGTFDERGVGALVFSSDRDLGGTDPDYAARAELQRRFQLQMAFRSGDGTATGPTLTLHVRRIEQP